MPGSHPRQCSADFRKELGRLSREALFGLLELVDALVERPSAYARLVENIGLALRNANFLLNLLRAHQVHMLSLRPARRSCCVIIAGSLEACDSTALLLKRWSAVVELLLRCVTCT